LGRLTRKTVSEMTYNVSSGTLNSTIPYLRSFSVDGIMHVVLQLILFKSSLALRSTFCRSDLQGQDS